MKICITAVSNTLDSQLDSRFGRSPWFIILDPETMEYEAVPNSAIKSMHGAGIQAARLIVDKGANLVISGNIGPNAYNVLSAEGLNVITGVSGTVTNIIGRYKNGELKPSSSPTVRGHGGRGNRWR
jgi:predicted Fe-Mo cluster-binding NifX family protein